MNVISNNSGDAQFSEDFRNPRNIVGANPNETDSVIDKYVKITEQRSRIVESFLAEHAGLLPSQIRQVTITLPNGDVTWHVEMMT